MALKVLIVLITILVIFFFFYWIYVALKLRKGDSTYSPILISTPIDGWKSYKAIKKQLVYKTRSIFLESLPNYCCQVYEWLVRQ